MPAASMTVSAALIFSELGPTAAILSFSIKIESACSNGSRMAADERSDIDDCRSRHGLLPHIRDSLNFEQRELVDEMDDLDQR